MTYDSRTKNFSCDSCPENLEVDEDDFAAALAAAKMAGWRTYKGPDDMWAHSCPACTEDFAKEKRR